MDIGVDISTQLFPNPLTMLYTLAVTGVLFFFVYKYLFNPAREILAKRSAYMQDKLTSAAKQNEEAEEHLASAKAQIDKAQDLAQAILKQADKEAGALKETIVDAANVKAAEIYARANERIKKEEKELRQEINKQIVDVALAANEKLLGEKDLRQETAKSLAKIVEELERESGQ